MNEMRDNSPAVADGPGDPAPSGGPEEAAAGRPLDAIDHRIIDLLHGDGRLSNKELAAQVGLAPSSCLQRVRRLVAEGVILGFHADVDASAVGFGLQAMMSVRLVRHSREAVEAFRAHVLTIDEVVAMYHIGGSHDFLLHVVVRDAEHLRDMAMDALTTRPEVANLETHLIFEQRTLHRLPRHRGV